MATIAIVQGVYYLITGIWSLVHIDSFQHLTGPKTDLWLVKTVGVLVSAIGAGLILGGLNNQVLSGLVLIATSSAIGLIGIDLVYVFKRVISPIYAADALIEFGLLLWWIFSLVFF